MMVLFVIFSTIVKLNLVNYLLFQPRRLVIPEEYTKPPYTMPQRSDLTVTAVSWFLEYFCFILHGNKKILLCLSSFVLFIQDRKIYEIILGYWVWCSRLFVAVVVVVLDDDVVDVVFVFSFLLCVFWIIFDDQESRCKTWLQVWFRQVKYQQSHCHPRKHFSNKPLLWRKHGILINLFN